MKLGWSEDADGNVAITMTRDDYDSLLLALGRAAGCMSRDGDRAGVYRAVALLNRLNAGNPYYRPYVVPAEASRG
jgi:hypothetical protein